MRAMAFIAGLALLPGVVWAQQPVEDAPGLSATLAGRVCEDRDGDGRCAPGEPGLEGVRLVLSTGIEVSTDPRGRYHVTGVDARTPDATGGFHLRPGRHRVRVDPRTLPPGGKVSPEAATVEVPWGALVLQDFAVRVREESVKALAPALVEAPPQAEVRAEGVDFVATGKASPGDQVRVAGVEAQVDADGTYRATVPLQPGENVLSITATSVGGTARFFRQRVDVVRREASWLIAPREIEPVGVLRLPAGRQEEVPSGVASLRVEAPEGTQVSTPQGKVTVGPEGQAEVPLMLTPGRNAVPLELQRPGEPARMETVELLSVARPFFVGLLDVEGAYSLGDGAFQLHGRGSAHGEARLGEFQILGEVDLRDTDFRLLPHEDASAWLRPRVPERFQRSLDPERAINEWGDNSVTLAPNASEGRLRLDVRHDRYGHAGFGTYRAVWGEGEIGRYHQPLFGPFAELKAEAGPVRVGVDAFAGGLTDPVRGLSSRPAHEELHATGGSLYFLGASSIAEGSELLRVELRDGLTGLPLAEQHLVRGRDYEIDYAAGRILLARPLSFLAGSPWLRTDALTAAPEPVLVADYAALELAGSQDAAGGEAWAEWLGARVSVGAVRERRAGAPYQLLSGRARGAIGSYTLEAEVARSAGLAIAPGAFGISDDGGLTYLRPGTDIASGGDALGLRVRGPGRSAGARWMRPSAGGSEASPTASTRRPRSSGSSP